MEINMTEEALKSNAFSRGENSCWTIWNIITKIKDICLVLTVIKRKKLV